MNYVSMTIKMFNHTALIQTEIPPADEDIKNIKPLLNHTVVKIGYPKEELNI